MMIWHWLANYGMFFAKTLTLVIAVLGTMAGILAIGSQHKNKKRMQFRTLNRDYHEKSCQLLEHCHDKKALKAACKKTKAFAKKPPSKRLYVLQFDGDIRARNVSQLRDEITTILLAHRPGDAVAIHIESGGGMVHAYGLAASQLARLRDANIPLTALIDKVAASGGYMMASVANQIIAAPFAIIGSIGVLAQIPNFHRWLQKNTIDFEQITAGQYKRTLTMLGENTDEGREKFRSEIEAVHELFKQFVKTYRPQLNMEAVATGEHWYGTQALDLQLIDHCQTSDDFLCRHLNDWQLVSIQSQPPKRLLDKLGQKALACWHHLWHPTPHSLS